MHQFLHLEALNVAHAQPVAVGIEQLAVSAAEHVRRERLAQHVGLQQHRQAGERALLHRRTRKTDERRPDGRLLIRADCNAFVTQATFDPFGRPGAIALPVDSCERLKRNRTVSTQVVVLAAQAENGGAHRAPHVEGKDVRAGITAELHRQRGEQNRLAHAGRAGHQRVAHVADVRHQPEWRRTLGARDDQRRAVEVVVLLRPGPHRRHRHQMCEIKRRDDGLAHIGVGIARHRGQPGLHGVQGLRNGHKATALDDALHHPQLLVGRVGVGIQYGHGCSDVAEGDLIAAQLLQGRVRVRGLVAGIGIDQRAFLLEDGFAQQCQDVLALGEPLPAQAAQLLFCLGLVHAQEARAPAVGKAQAIEVVQNPRPGRGRKATHRHDAQVLVAQHGRQASDQGRVSQ